MEEYQANLFRPMYREKEEFSHECEECGCGIHLYEKYYTVPSGVFGLEQVLCEDCTMHHVSYARHTTECIYCGREIEENEDCFITGDEACICLDCLADMSTINVD